MLSLQKAAASLAPFEPLLKKALCHSYAERFTGPETLSDAFEEPAAAAMLEEIAQWGREGLPKVLRAQDGR